MVQFNELSVNLDKSILIIDVSIPDESYYEDVYIDRVIIDNQDTYVGTGPSSHPVYEYAVPLTIEGLNGEEEDNNLKHLRLVINSNELDCNLNSLFFVYIRTRGMYKPDTPCGCDEITTMASVTSMKPFYDNLMQYVREIGESCNIPKGFINQFLITKSLEVSVKTKNYPQAINIWNNRNNTKNKLHIGKGGCGCNGFS